jgi:DNA repair protein RecN (Recombination protein N)
LSIKNYALIEDIHVNFSNGLTVITGETGAGKSILIEGLSLILGARADIMSVKDTSKKCIIEGTFDISNYHLELFFADEDIDFDNETIIRREILPSGKSRAFINDSPVNLTTLSALGDMLIDVHSQHQNLSITDDVFQFKVIDALAKNDQKLSKYRSTLLSYKTLKNELNRLETVKSEAIREKDYNLFLYNELCEADLNSGAMELLEMEQRSLNNFEAIQAGLSESYQLLNDEQIGIINQLTSLRNNLKKLAELSEAYKDIYDRTQGALIEVEDIYSEVEQTKDNLEADPSRLQEINNQLDTIHGLLLKHSVNSIAELIEIREDLSNKMNLFENVDDEIARKQNLLDQKESELNKLANKIHEEREHAIPNLIDALKLILGDLGMENAEFEVTITMGEDYFENGKDVITFLFTANKGSDLKPLKQAVSGGEMSRIMLAIKAVITNYMQLPTIMFDEIDTGVSGEISNKIAKIMREMSRNMQVFAITHLPQIAAKGDVHLKVFKEDRNNMTITQIKNLGHEERIVEIAQMLSGTEMTNSAIAHAKELLN